MTTPRTLPPCDHDDCPPTHCKREELERTYSRLVVEYQRTQAERDSARRELAEEIEFINDTTNRCMELSTENISLHTQLGDAKRELEQLKKDKERLDWLIQTSVNDNSSSCQNNGEVQLGAATRIRQKDIRQAIDAAMRKETK